jgi:hypothetical protein
MRGMTVVASRRALRFAVFAVLCFAPHPACGDFTVASIVPFSLAFGAHGVDAHDDVAYVVGDGVTAVDVADVDAPTVLTTLTDPDLRGCTAVAAYTSSRGKRLAVACAGSNAIVVVDASAPNGGGLRVLGVIQDDTALRGVSSVIVRDYTLAFVTAPGMQRVVSLDLSEENAPRVLSFLALSAAHAVTFAHDSHIAVGAGNSHGGGRVTVIKYTPSGVMMKVGSIKDGRLGGKFRAVQTFPAREEFSFAATLANGGNVVLVNATTRAVPVITVHLQAQGRAAASASVPSSEEDESDDGNAGWTPNGHRSLAGAVAFAAAANRIMYVASAEAGTVVGIDATDLKKPVLAHIVTDPQLRGVSDLCARGGRAAAAAAAKASAAGVTGESNETNTAPSGGGAVLFAVVPSANRLVVLRDGGGSAAAVSNDEL